MRTLVGAMTIAAMLALSGCGGGDPIPTLPPSPSATPIFASEEEALAAAEAAYAAYSEMSDVISTEGGRDPERIRPFVTEERFEDELRGFSTLRESNLHIQGSAQFTVLDVQRYDEVGGDAEVVFYACWDASESRVINSSGEDVTPANREDRLVLEVYMRTVDGRLPLVLESDDAWPGEDC